ncbi:hypothetical protein K474DRAFT_1379867 [Panus rudis PR-1116 ss-1]|nr:hypothetical protein K474DRAFT_1379867 [Panus rudis PR-1116 ss-1]
MTSRNHTDSPANNESSSSRSSSSRRHPSNAHLEPAPYLTHVVTHHGQLTLIPPQNAGRIRKAKPKSVRNDGGSGGRESASRRDRQPPAEPRFNTAVPSPHRRTHSRPQRPGRNMPRAAVPDPDPDIPSEPPPSFQEAIATPPYRPPPDHPVNLPIQSAPLPTVPEPGQIVEPPPSIQAPPWTGPREPLQTIIPSPSPFPAPEGISSDLSEPAPSTPDSHENPASATDGEIGDNEGEGEGASSSSEPELVELEPEEWWNNDRQMGLPLDARAQRERERERERLLRHNDPAMKSSLTIATIATNRSPSPVPPDSSASGSHSHSMEPQRSRGDRHRQKTSDETVNGQRDAEDISPPAEISKSEGNSSDNGNNHSHLKTLRRIFSRPQFHSSHVHHPMHAQTHSAPPSPLTLSSLATSSINPAAQSTITLSSMHTTNTSFSPTGNGKRSPLSISVLKKKNYREKEKEKEREKDEVTTPSAMFRRLFPGSVGGASSPPHSSYKGKEKEKHVSDEEWEVVDRSSTAGDIDPMSPASPMPTTPASASGSSSPSFPPSHRHYASNANPSSSPSTSKLKSGLRLKSALRSSPSTATLVIPPSSPSSSSPFSSSANNPHSNSSNRPKRGTRLRLVGAFVAYYIYPDVHI